MPILTGRVRVNTTKGAVLDLTDNNNNSSTSRSQVKGLGLFNSVLSRNDIDENLRAQGYMAVVKTGEDTVTPYFYNKESKEDNDWTTEGNWSSFSSSNGLPVGGDENGVLSKNSATSFDAGWVNSIVIEGASLIKTGEAPTEPVLTFSRKKDNALLPIGSVLGEVKSLAYDSSGSSYDTASIKFTTNGEVGDSIGSSVEFFVTDSSSAAPEKAFSITYDKKVIFASLDEDNIPLAEAGGMYYNITTNAYFLAI